MFKKNILIFCQSPADLKYVLSIYKHHKSQGNKCTVVVREVLGIYKFVKSMSLDLDDLIFMNVYSLKTILGSFKQIYHARRIIRTLNEKKYDEVYLFSNLFDFVTPYIIRRIKREKVYYYDHFNRNHTNVVSNTFYEIIRWLILRVFFQANTRVVDDARLLYVYCDDIIDESITPGNVDVPPEFLINISNNDKKNILFFDSNDAVNPVILNAENNFLEFCSVVSSFGYEITVKGHPRLGVSKYILERNYTLLDESIPSEFINVSNFDLFFSVYSSSLASLPKNISFSLIGYFDVSSPGYYVNYLKGLGLVNEQFIETENDLSRVFNGD